MSFPANYPQVDMDDKDDTTQEKLTKTVTDAFDTYLGVHSLLSTVKNVKGKIDKAGDVAKKVQDTGNRLTSSPESEAGQTLSPEASDVGSSFGC